jgi:hypothetical protein
LNYEKICKTVEEKPHFFDKYRPVEDPGPKEPDGTEEDSCVSFVDVIHDLAREAAIVEKTAKGDEADAEIDKILFAEFGYNTLLSVPEEEQEAIIQHFQGLVAQE